MNMCKHFIPLLRKSKQSSIIQISSIAGRLTVPYFGLYSSTKFALESYSDALRAEVKSQGINVVSIQPGYFKSDIGKTAKQNSDNFGVKFPEESKKYYPNIDLFVSSPQGFIFFFYIYTFILKNLNYQKIDQIHILFRN